jgi:hypothetical protein
MIEMKRKIKAILSTVFKRKLYQFDLSNSYSGSKVEKYEIDRSKNPKWKFENESFQLFFNKIINEVKIIVDAPVGTGRFIAMIEPFIENRKIYCMDYSEDMLKESANKTKSKNFIFLKHDLVCHEVSYTPDLVLCSRFLNLINWNDCQKVLRNILGPTKKYALLNVRLSDSPDEVIKIENKINVHSKKKFISVVNSMGFEIVDQKSFQDSKAGTYFTYLFKRVV